MWQIPCKMTNSSSKPLQTLGKWYQPRNPKKNPKPVQKKIPKTISHPYISIYKWQTSAFCSCAIHVTRVRSSIRSSIRGSRMLEIPIGAEPRLICCLVMSRYSIYSQQCGLQTARVGPTWSILGLQVGNLQHLQPAMRATNNMGGANTRHLGAVGWQPTALQPAMRATNSRGGADMRHLGAVGWQPTAFTASNGP